MIDSWRDASPTFSEVETFGNCTGTPFTITGVSTMKMISSTRQTSTSGVTLMFDSRAAAREVCMAGILLIRFDTATRANETSANLRGVCCG